MVEYFEPKGHGYVVTDINIGKMSPFGLSQKPEIIAAMDKWLATRPGGAY